MNPSRLAGLIAVVAIVTFLFPTRSWAEGPASLKDVHELLMQAAGDSADNPPPAEKQKALLDDALKKMHHVPHVYRGRLNAAMRDIEAALNELSGSDTSHKARHDILDADDIIKSLMD